MTKTQKEVAWWTMTIDDGIDLQDEKKGIFQRVEIITKIPVALHLHTEEEVNMTEIETIKVGIETTIVEIGTVVEIENPGIRIDDPIDALEVAVVSDVAARKSY